MPGYYAAGHLMPKVSSFTLLILVFSICILETVQDFLIKLDIKPLMHLLEINIFSLNKDLLRLTEIMNILVKDLKILSFRGIFHCQKLVESFLYFILWRMEGPNFNKDIYGHFKYLNTLYPCYSILIFTLKVESLSKNIIFGLIMMVRSGLEKNILKFLNEGR